MLKHSCQIYIDLLHCHQNEAAVGIDGSVKYDIILVHVLLYIVCACVHACFKEPEGSKKFTPYCYVLWLNSPI